VPTGHGEFHFSAANLDFSATGFTWLVVTDRDAEAFFEGTGTVNGISGYEFLVSVVDGSPDRARIKVWETVSGTVVYDNEAGAPDPPVP
jgi:hypothetical protein